MTAAVIPARVPTRSWRSEARAVRTVWRRDLIRFVHEPLGIVSWLLQPLLFLLVLGPGLQTLSARATEGVALTTFLFPGVVCMALLYSGMFSAASLVWDRELGFLRELLVAPVRRSSVLLGKCLGGATIAVSQGVLVLALAGAVGIPYDPVLLLGAVGLAVVIACAITAFGVLVAVWIRQARTFTSVMQLFVFPMMFLSGALFPVGDLPAWLRVLNRLMPLTYAVDPMRRLVFDRLDVSHGARATLAPGVTWFGWTVPVALEVGIVVVLAGAMLAGAVIRFARTE